MRRSSALAWVFLLPFSDTLAFQSVVFEPVPAELLRDRTLLVENYNRTVDAPADGWVWLRSVRPSEQNPGAGAPTRYYAVNPEQPDAFIFWVLDDETWRKAPTLSYMTGLRERFRAEAEAAAGVLSDFRSSPADLPVNDSFRFSYRVDQEGGPPTFYYGYVGGAWVKYILAVKTSRQGEPSLLGEFAASCKMLNRKPY